MKTSNQVLTVLLILVISISFLSNIKAQNIYPPTCYSGKHLLKEFIREEMVYPEKALKKKIEGTVELSFIVKPDGKTGNLSVIAPVSPEIDAEAIRIFNKVLWNPATDLGKPIAMIQTLEIKFNIKKYKKLIKERGYDYFTYPYEPIDSSNHVFKMKQVDKYPKPVFSSQDVNFSNFVARNLKYPEAAFKQNVSGIVKLKFVVEQSGRISNIVVVETIGGGTTSEAIRVVKLMKWHPGINKGKAVRTFMQIEIRFDIAKKTVGGSVPSQGGF